MNKIEVGLENKIKTTVEKCFFAVEQRVIFAAEPHVIKSWIIIPFHCIQELTDTVL